MQASFEPGYFLLVGAPGTGKTTTLKQLGDRGFACREEAARFVLEHQLATRGPALPSNDPLLFIQAMQKKSIEDFSHAKSEKQPVFFDRGMPDLIHYAIRFKVDASEFEASSKKYRYNKNVFVFSPWKEIYANDHVRPLPFEKTVEIQELLENVYRNSGYNLIRVPFGSPEERVKFILAQVESTPKNLEE